jgi:hypothetical protein
MSRSSAPRCASLSFRALRLFLARNDQLVISKANVDIFLVYARKFGGNFEGIICFRYTDCRNASPNAGRRFLSESTKRVFHFAPHHSERVQFLAPLSRKTHLFSPSARENIEFLLTMRDLDPAQTVSASTQLRKPGKQGDGLGRKNEVAPGIVHRASHAQRFNHGNR